MLKSLGQWTAASLKPWSSKPPSSDKEQEESNIQEESKYVRIFVKNV